MSTPPTSKSPGTPNARLPDRSPSRGVPASTGQGLARNPSLRSARPIRKGPARSSMGPDTALDEDVKAANAQVIADLKEQVERAEAASEQYRKQLEAMQIRLDEVSNETTAAEEREFQFRTQIDKLQAEIRDNARQNRELEISFESEKKLLLQDRENRSNKESELQSVVNRLTENLKLKNQELVHTNRKGSPERKRDEPDTPDNAANSGQDYLRILEQKDTTIESLRLELADFHLKMAEQEHMGDGRSQVLEKEILDVKMRNARLQEENESFQMLLSEKTLKGDFMHDHQTIHEESANSLAEELESAEQSLDNTPEGHKRLEIENKTLKDSNKALTLYIDKIIGRLLKHEGFERIITEKDEDDAPTPLPKRVGSAEKALPDIPQQDYFFNESSPDSSRPPTASAAIANATSAAAGFLQRARSVVSRPAAAPGPRSRPVSYVPAMPTANENPDTAPSIPINRTHRRARSDQANDMGAATVVQQMNRGSPLRTTSGGLVSPGMSPLSPASGNRISYFGLNNATAPTTRASSGSNPAARPVSSSNSMVSDHSLEVERDSTDASSARASVHSSAGAALPGAVMKQNQLRPLRLVQEQAQADEDMTKKANRGSWMGWFNKGANEPPPE